MTHRESRRDADDLEEVQDHLSREPPDHVPPRLADEDPRKLAKRRSRRPGVNHPPCRVDQHGQGHPEDLAHFVVLSDRDPRRQAKDEGRENQRPDPARAGVTIVQLTESLGRSQIDADLLVGLAQGGGFWAIVARIDAPPGESHLPRPGIGGVLRALDEEHVEVPTFPGEDHGHAGVPWPLEPARPVSRNRAANRFQRRRRRPGHGPATYRVPRSLAIASI